MVSSNFRLVRSLASGEVWVLNCHIDTLEVGYLIENDSRFRRGDLHWNGRIPMDSNLRYALRVLHCQARGAADRAANRDPGAPGQRKAFGKTKT